MCYGTDVSNGTSKNPIDNSSTKNLSSNSVKYQIQSGTEHVLEKPSKTLNTNSSLTDLRDPKISNESKTKNVDKVVNPTSQKEENSLKNRNDVIQKLNTNDHNSDAHVNYSLPLSSTTNKPPTEETNRKILKNVTASTAEPTVRKPLLTVHDEEADKMDPTSKKINLSSQNVLNIDHLENEKDKSSNYVVPIVAIIFSVPFVAALISVLYKRFKDWWLHRNYRRMDYLIEGLYNS